MAKKITKRKKVTRKRKNPTFVERLFGKKPRTLDGNTVTIKVEDGTVLLTGGFGDISEAHKEINDLLEKSDKDIRFEFIPNSSPNKRYVLNKLEILAVQKESNRLKRRGKDDENDIRKLLRQRGS